MTLTTFLMSIGGFVLVVFIFHKVMENLYDRWYLKNLRKRKKIATDEFV